MERREAEFKVEMGKCIGHFKTFEKAIDLNKRGLELAHDRIDRRGLATELRKAEQRIMSLEGSVDMLKGKVS